MFRKPSARASVDFDFVSIAFCISSSIFTMRVINNIVVFVHTCAQ